VVHPSIPREEGRVGITLEIVRAWQYFIFVFIAVIGMLQLIAVCNQLKGMLFIRNRPITLALSIAAIVFAFWWFFYRDSRVDTVMRRTGLEGAQQFTVFCWTTFTALVVTLVLSSLLQMFVYRRNRRSEPEERIEGAYQLRYMSWFEALRQALRQRDKSDAGTHHPG
jgi:predicted acyltransferase